MTVRYTVAPRRIEVRARGRITEAEAASLIASLAADPRIAGEVGMLFDASQADADPAPGELARIAGLFSVLRPGLTRIAVLAGSDIMYGLAREYSAYAESVGIAVRPFRQREEALRWLGWREAVGVE